MVAREIVGGVQGEPVGGSLEGHIAEFARFLVREDRSPATVRSYEWGLYDLRDFLESRGITNLAGLTRATLEAWQDRLVAVRMKPRSRSLATTAARMFFKWAADHDLCDPRLKEWLVSVRLRPLKPKPLPTADLTALLKHFEMPSGDVQALRNRAMFLVYLTTGLRVSEGLQLPRVGYERTEVRQKGGTEKLVTIPEHVQVAVREYLAARVDNSPRLFVTHPAGRPMTPGSVRAAFHQVAGQVGVAPFTTHQLRHTFATQLLAQGIDIRVVAELMGHKNLQSIMGYTEVYEPARLEAMEAIDRVIHPATSPLPADPRMLTKPALVKTRRRGRPRFRLVP